MPKIELELRGDAPTTPAVVRRQWRGLECEQVKLTAPVAFDYAWNGETNYLALHDIQLTDGLAFLESREPRKILDLRNRMTFAPQGARIEGWSALAGEENSYTALFFRSELLKDELGAKAPLAPTKPALYFENATLLAAMERLRAALAGDAPPDPAYLETIGLLCALELGRLNRVVDYRETPTVGRLARRAEATLREFIRDNLHRPIGLDELAALVGLSRFHFIRSFKATFGAPPHQYLVMQRVTRATELLVTTNAPLAEIAQRAGFSSHQQFTTVFRKATGIAPGQFRRQL